MAFHLALAGSSAVSLSTTAGGWNKAVRTRLIACIVPIEAGVRRVRNQSKRTDTRPVGHTQKWYHMIVNLGLLGFIFIFLVWKTIPFTLNRSANGNLHLNGATYGYKISEAFVFKRLFSFHTIWLSRNAKTIFHCNSM